MSWGTTKSQYHPDEPSDFLRRYRKYFDAVIFSQFFFTTFFFQSSDSNKNDEDMINVSGHESKKHSTSGLKKSAAGICVGMGSFADPAELAGLAHFLEHMVGAFLR